ncbi:MAG: citrate/2-methylcitrate synthase [Lachnospiraceae bacterium]|nr:citrate/2-methylcitrate synthase [Lachnospiraceae bacterium]
MMNQYEDIYKIDESLYDEYNVKRGLRDKNGNGVLAGISDISRIEAYKLVDGVKTPCEGKLIYRGYDVQNLVEGVVNEKHFGFEETAFLLLFGHLPNREELETFSDVLSNLSVLPDHFVRDVVMKAPSSDIMNSMTKSILTLASYDPKATDLSLDNVLRQCIMLIGQLPMLAVYGYQAYSHYRLSENLYIHRPDVGLSMAENILRMLRPDMQYTNLEAKVLDIALMLHMEHGGGNNSTFTTRVVTSSGADTYSVMAAALCSLKGPKHGGANIKVMEMIRDLKQRVSDTHNESEVRDYLVKLLDKQAFDKKGLIYGMGHAVYSISDPRAKAFKGFVEKLAVEKQKEEEFELYSMIERLAPEVISEKRKIYKGVSANVDFYSGFVYSMLDIPVELYTPIFAIARIVGWSAHRLEELISGDKIIRPAYKTIVEDREYIPLNDRK